MKIKLTLIFLLAITITNAGNLLVKEYGVNGTFSTIQNAIDAASSGDTIIVFNKPSGQLWLENIVIDKQIFLENANSDERFNKLDGDIQIVPSNGLKLFFVGLDLQNGHKIYTSSSANDPENRCEINIIDCTMDEVEFEDNYLKVRLLDSSIDNVKFRYGIMAGCSGNDLTISKGNSTESTDSIVIVGNTGYDGVIDSYYSIRVFNNFFTTNSNFPAQNSTCGCYNNCYTDYGTTNVLKINDVNSNATAKNIIANNTFRVLGGEITSSFNNGSSCYNNRHHYTRKTEVALSVRYRNNFYIYNNAFNGDSNGNGNRQKSITNNGGSGTPFVSHNYLENGVSSIEIGTNNEINYNNKSFNIDGYGRVSNQGVDGGIYLGQYNDIDLTRNDVGTYGGPYSINNYHNIMPNENGGKGRVHYIELPNFLSEPTDINLKGGAHSVE